MALAGAFLALWGVVTGVSRLPLRTDRARGV
jgi:hypothetical protein